MESLFRNTLSPMQWAVLAAIPPAILALYFLKLRRMPVEVPSTYLWMRAIEDLHVNSLWQRLRKSLLLLLQLLLIGLVILALLRPGWQGTKLVGQRFLFLVDNSASMSATDVDEAESRLELVKQRVAGLIDQLDRGTTAMIISFAGSPRVVQEFTDNRRLLRERLESIRPTYEKTDLLGALKLADGLANPGQVIAEEDAPGMEVVEPVDSTLYLFTDGGFEVVSGFSLGNLAPVYVPAGKPTTGNLAITAFSTRQSEVRPEERQAFVQVTNLSEVAVDAVVEVALDSVFLDAREANIPAGESVGLSYPLADAAEGELTAKLDAASLAAVGDQLEIDNIAYVGLNQNRPGRVLLVTDGNLALETALTTGRVERFGELIRIKTADLDTPEYKKPAASGDYDLIIYDRCQPETMPQADTFFVGMVPPLPNWKPDVVGEDATKDGAVGRGIEEVQFPQVVDWNRAHPLLAYVELANLWIYRATPLSPPTGGSTLLDTTAGSMLAIAPRGSFEDTALGFPILIEEEGRVMGNTRWFSRRSFPTFWYNVVSYFVGQARTADRNSVAAGEPIDIVPASNTNEIVVTNPAGMTSTIKRQGQEPFTFQQTDQLGVYQVAEAGVVTQRFAVNLFDRRESDLRLASTGEPSQIDDLQIGYVNVEAKPAAAAARIEIWRPLLLVALGVLLFEWYVYNRRVYF